MMTWCPTCQRHTQRNARRNDCRRCGQRFDAKGCEVERFEERNAGNISALERRELAALRDFYDFVSDMMIEQPGALDEYRADDPEGYARLMELSAVVVRADVAREASGGVVQRPIVPAHRPAPQEHEADGRKGRRLAHQQRPDSDPIRLKGIVGDRVTISGSPSPTRAAIARALAATGLEVRHARTGLLACGPVAIRLRDVRARL